jgi:hypothetical protein
MIIELVGAPGSGKSYLFKKYLLKLKERGATVATIEDIKTYKKANKNLWFFFFIRSLIRFQSIFLFYKVMTLKKVNYNMKKNLFKWYLNCITNYEIIKNLTFDYFLIDEGKIQRFIACFVSEKNFYDKSVFDLLNNFDHKNYRLVFINCTVQKCLERVNQREIIARFINKSDDARLNIIKNFIKSLNNFFNNNKFKYVNFINNKF